MVVTPSTWNGSRTALRKTDLVYTLVCVLQFQMANNMKWMINSRGCENDVFTVSLSPVYLNDIAVWNLCFYHLLLMNTLVSCVIVCMYTKPYHIHTCTLLPLIGFGIEFSGDVYSQCSRSCRITLWSLMRFHQNILPRSFLGKLRYGRSAPYENETKKKN